MVEYKCPNCGAYVEKKKVNNFEMWFCTKCVFCTSFDENLKREYPVDSIERKRAEFAEEKKQLYAFFAIM